MVEIRRDNGRGEKTNAKTHEHDSISRGDELDNNFFSLQVLNSCMPDSLAIRRFCSLRDRSPELHEYKRRAPDPSHDKSKQRNGRTKVQ